MLPENSGTGGRTPPVNVASNLTGNRRHNNFEGLNLSDVNMSRSHDNSMAKASRPSREEGRKELGQGFRNKNIINGGSGNVIRAGGRLKSMKVKGLFRGKGTEPDKGKGLQVVAVNNVSVKVPHEDNRQMSISSAVIMKILDKGTGVVRERAVNVETGDPGTFKKNAEEAKVATSMPRGKRGRDRRLIGRKVLPNKESNTQVLFIDRITIGILLLGGEGTSKR